MRVDQMDLYPLYVKDGRGEPNMHRLLSAAQNANLTRADPIELNHGLRRRAGYILSVVVLKRE